MALGELLGGALSIVVEVLFDRLAPRLTVPFKRKRRNEEQRQGFEIKFRSAIALLKDAEEKQLADDNVRKWLHNLNEVIYRADELNDDIEYEELRHQREGDSIMSTFVSWFYSSVEVPMEQILADLDRLSNQKAHLGLNEISLRSPCSPLVIESEVFGREDDKAAIMKLVRLDNELMVVPIVGMGGIGKTTLAQLVFNDDSLKFQKKVWVSVSPESDVLNITKQIFKGVTSTESSIKDILKLQSDLKNALERKKFLFVLDDYWNEDYHFWDALRPPFTYGASGSKIVITTRSRKVASIVNNKGEEPINLGGLSVSSCLEFFIRRALKKEDLNAHRDLHEIAEKLVLKCEGLPVAVKSVAALLGPSPEDWRTISENKMWESKLREDILPALWLSYSYLSPQLKRCFAYCSLFPKDHEFRKGEVILLWTAEGLLHSKGGATMEDVGVEYFEILTSRSFFQPVESKSSFIMHGFMHDLATFVLGDFGFRLEKNDLDELPKRTRHLSIMKKDIHHLKQVDGAFDAKFLHTFLTLKSNASPGEQHRVQLPELKSKEKRLRVVSLSHYLSIEDFPAYVKNLKHLRYLDLSFTAIKEIPSTICSLHQLETLLLRGCRSLTGLPAEIGGLLKLRHIDFDACRVKEIPLQIGDLKDLQTFSRFNVREEDGGSSIKELGKLVHLRGKFDIWGLENVVDVENVSAAKLSDKKFVMLGLYWDGYSDDSTDSGKHSLVLDQLRPHTNLEELRISGYNGRSFSEWMGDQSFNKIKKIELFKCGSCDSLSPIERLPSLKKLFISQWQVETLRSVFNSNGSSETGAFEHLEYLSFENMPNWKEWLIDGAGFPCLKQLQFYGCPQLHLRLPDCFPELTKLAVRNCGRLNPFLTSENTHPGSGFSSLKELQIHCCTEQEYFSNEELGLPSSVKIRVHRSL